MWLLLLSLVPHAYASCADRDAVIEEAEAKVLEFDLQAAEAALREAEGLITCGAAMDRTMLARFWLAEAVLLHNLGEDRDATLSFAAASRVANEYWNPAYGPEMRRLFEKAVRAEDGSGEIQVDPPPDNYIIVIDGVPAVSPLQVSTGLHLVQAGQAFSDLTFAKIVLVTKNDTAVVPTGIAPVVVAPTELPPPEPTPPKEPGNGLRVHVALGPSLAVGRSLGDKEAFGIFEPGGKFSLPIEAGMGVELGNLWARGALAMAPMLGGQWLWADSDGDAHSSALAWGGHVAGGLDVQDVEVGLLLGGLFPGRLSAHGVGSVGFGELPIRLEGRLGLNVGTGGRVEGAGSAFVVFAPTL